MSRTVFANRDAVAWCRHMRGMTQEDLAAKAELDVRIIRKAEAGDSLFRNTLAAIATALGVDAEFLSSSLASAPIAARSFPKALRTLVKDIHAAEIAGDFAHACRLLKSAVELGDACSASQREALGQRLKTNQELGKAQQEAYKGTTEPLIWYWNDSGVVKYASKSEVHAKGWRHPTVILLFRTANGRCAWYSRSESQQCGSQRDFFGGHFLRADTSSYSAAVREANEEFCLYAGKVRIPVNGGWFARVGREFEFEWESPGNRECSTVFVVTLPSHPALSAVAVDEDATGGRIVSIPMIRYDRLDTLLEAYDKQPSMFADGAARVLRRYREDQRIASAIDERFASR